MRPGWLFCSLLAVHALPGRFRPIFFQRYDLSNSQIGIVLSTPGLVALFTNPVICGYSDKSGKHRQVIIGVALLVMVSFLLQLPALPSFNLFSQNLRFLYLAICNGIFGIFIGATYPLVSALSINYLNAKFGSEGHHRFGQERLFGAVSWAIIALLLGVLFDIPGFQLWIVHILLTLAGFIFVITLLLFFKATAEKAADDAEQPALIAAEALENDDDADDTTPDECATSAQSPHAEMTVPQAISQILLKGGLSNVLFFNLVFWLSCGMTLVENLLFLYIVDELHSTNLICGVSVLITVLFQFPFFLAAPYLLRHNSASTLAILGALSYAVRAAGYAMAPRAWVVLAVEPLHGVTYSLFHTASVAYVVERTPGRFVATGQAMLMVVSGLAKTLAPCVGGFVIQGFGSRVLYAGVAMLVMAASVGFAVAEWREKRRTVG